jgi:hypothetical protein
MDSEMKQASENYRKVTRLRALDLETAELRKELGFSNPGEVIFQESLSADRSIVVIASGYGAATIQVNDGDYDPQNSQALASREYLNEADAVAKATRMYEEGSDESALEEDEG